MVYTYGIRPIFGIGIHGFFCIHEDITVKSVLAVENGSFSFLLRVYTGISIIFISLVSNFTLWDGQIMEVLSVRISENQKVKLSKLMLFLGLGSMETEGFRSEKFRAMIDKLYEMHINGKRLSTVTNTTKKDWVYCKQAGDYVNPLIRCMRCRTVSFRIWLECEHTIKKHNINPDLIPKIKPQKWRTK